MGIVPPVDPIQAASAWVIARVESIEPKDPCWGRPARLGLVVEEVLRGAPPARLSLTLGPPIGSGQQYFYVIRHLGAPPWSAEVEADVKRQREQLDATPIAAPFAGERIAVGISEHAPGQWVVRSTGDAWVPEARFPALRRQLRGEPPVAVPTPTRARSGLVLVIAGVLALAGSFGLGLVRGERGAVVLAALAGLALAIGAWRIARP